MRDLASACVEDEPALPARIEQILVSLGSRSGRDEGAVVGEVGDVVAELEEAVVEEGLHRLLGYLGRIYLEQQVLLDHRGGTARIAAERVDGDVSGLRLQHHPRRQHRAGKAVEGHFDARIALLELRDTLLAADFLLALGIEDDLAFLLGGRIELLQQVLPGRGARGSATQEGGCDKRDDQAPLNAHSFLLRRPERIRSLSLLRSRKFPLRVVRRTSLPSPTLQRSRGFQYSSRSATGSTRL